MPSRRTAPSNLIPPSPSPPLPPPPPPPPPRPPLRSRRKSKSPSSRSNHAASKRALDLDKIEATSDPEDARPTRRGSRDLRGFKDSELDRKWEGVASELRSRGSRMRSAVYQTSDLPSMIKAKRHLEPREGKEQIDRSKLKATFV
ncbi:leiomodin-2-like [Anabas testudineus]|uniref:leiomodin-2-like n=1 Tax=Anabas testudineus TaxID=64144 RepID=UPI000E45576D|nr:leiomodin-2-like [Anabas testudineus]